MLMDLTTISYDSFVTETDLTQIAIDSSRTSLMTYLDHETSKKGVCCLEFSKKIQKFLKIFLHMEKGLLKKDIEPNILLYKKNSR
jgi:hypothetical protein